MTHSKYLVFQAGLHLCQLGAQFSPDEVQALLTDPAFQEAAAAMHAACMEDDILATERYCTRWWQAGQTAMLAARQRKRSHDDG